AAEEPAFAAARAAALQAAAEGGPETRGHARINAARLGTIADGFLEVARIQDPGDRAVERVVERLLVVLDAAGVAVILGRSFDVILPAAVAELRRYGDVSFVAGAVQHVLAGGDL